MFKKISVILVTSLLFVSCTNRSSESLNSIDYALRLNVKGLDPAHGGEAASSEIMPNIYEGLVEYHYLKRPLELQPLLAESMPDVSKDFTTFKFKIRKGIKFQDSPAFPDGKGRELVAQDFVYSFKRVADPRGKQESYWIFDGRVKGLNEWHDRITKNEGKFEDPIEGFETPDNYTLVIKLTKPSPQFLMMLAMPAACVVPHEAVEKYGEEFLNHPVGTGPFRFDSWIRNNKVVLVRNPTWHGGTYPTEGAAGDKEAGLLADAGKPLPFVDRLVFHEIVESQTRWLNFMKGSMDLALVPKDNYDAAIANGELKPELVQKGVKVFRYPFIETAYMAFNMDDPILGKNADLRKAMALAYDGAAARTKFYNDQAIEAQAPLAPELEGYDPDFKNPYKQHNLEKAKELLKKAGYPGGKGLPTFEYNSPNSPDGRQIAEFAKQQFAQIGVNVDIALQTWPQFTDRIHQRKAQMFGMSWLVDYPDQTNMLQVLYGRNASPGPNGANYKNPEFDKLFEQAERLGPGPERKALFQKMRDIFVKDMPWIPTVHRISSMTYHGWLNNLKRHEIVKTGWKYMRVDVDKKKELKSKL